MFVSAIVVAALAAAAAAAAATSASASVALNDTEVKFVMVVTRHGARTPYSVLPQGVEASWDCTLRHLSLMSDTPVTTSSVPAPRLTRKSYIKGREILPGNCMQGQLTETGYRMHLALGRRLRETYITGGPRLLPEQGYPSSSQLYVRSTDVPRTVASAEGHLQGLFPAPGSTGSEGVDDAADDVQVVDIEVVDHGVEDMSPGKKCAAMVKQCNNVSNLLEYKERAAALEDLKASLASSWGVATNDMLPWDSIWDNLYARTYHNLPMPKGVTPAAKERIQAFANYTIETAYGYKQVTRYGIGVFLSEMMDRFKAAVTESSPVKWVYYSGHDTTTALILQAFDQLAGRGWPPYAANIVFELRKKPSGGSDTYIRMLYMGEPLSLPGCGGELCPFDTFAAMAAKTAITQQEWLQECGPKGSVAAENWYASFLC